MKYNYYKLLGVPEYSDTEVIKRAYRTMAKKYHPDKNESDSSKAFFQELNEAYQVLTDPYKRALYDAQLGLVLEEINQQPLSPAEERKKKRAERRKANYEYSRSVHQPPEFWVPPVWVKLFFYFVGLLFGLVMNYFSLYYIITGEWSVVMIFVNFLALIVLIDAVAGLIKGEALFSEQLLKRIKSWFLPRF